MNTAKGTVSHEKKICPEIVGVSVNKALFSISSGLPATYHGSGNAAKRSNLKF